ncbi:MAG: arginine--tRNA ligase [Minisyncoccia bacterium]|jgi:arginyl-tRNA synthetase
MEEKIRKAVNDAFRKIGAESGAFVVERPSDMARGDYAVFIGMEMAEEVAKRMREDLGDIASKIEVAGPGFVNITLARETVTLVVAEADAQGVEWGEGSANTGQRVMIEYTDPNPFKEMHIGHLMSNVIGETLARLIENEGATVIRVNYQGDVGPHVAKALWGLQRADIAEPTTAKEISAAYAAGARAYEGSLDARAEINALNQTLYAATDHALMELWRKSRDVSLAAFEKLYKILGTKFDYYFFESETAESGMRIVKEGLTKGIFEESEGAIVYRGEKKGLHTLVFITSAGTPTYETKDIGLAFLKEERVQSDRSLIVTAAEQTGHFKVVLAVLGEIAPLVAKKTEHVSHGFLRLTSGKMSSRTGNVITAAQFIEEVTTRASEKNPNPLIAEQVALGAIKYMILRQSPGSDIIFDPEKSLSLEGDSGPYLQYALVRAKSVLAHPEAGSRKPEAGSPAEPAPLERLILHFSEVTARAARGRAPNLLVNYLTELAGDWNSFYAKERIVGGEYEAHKLMLARAFVNTMTNGLLLLGIPAPEKM